jgi:hypothetical protein
LHAFGRRKVLCGGPAPLTLASLGVAESSGYPGRGGTLMAVRVGGISRAIPRNDAADVWSAATGGLTNGPRPGIVTHLYRLLNRARSFSLRMGRLNRAPAHPWSRRDAASSRPWRHFSHEPEHHAEAEAEH